MKRTVWIDGTRHDLLPAMLIGQGGEAEVYDLGDSRVVKWWKPADHPDFVGLPHAQDAATRRLADAAAKLRALPIGLPPAVVAPRGFALAAKRSNEVVGYIMPRVTGEPLCSYGEPRWRRDHAIDARDVVAVLLALHDAIAGLHAAGVVIGDCNDLNVLVDGRRVHLIDVDSYQYGAFICTMFSERFVDPRLCDPTQPGSPPLRPHDRDSDWFAFAAITLRSLLGVGPWGGVHAPKDPADRIAPSARAARRASIFSPDITYPRAARPIAILSDDLIAALRAIFEQDRRGEFPRSLLANVNLVPCASCGEAYARARTQCPSCRAIAPRPIAISTGKLRHHAIAATEVATGTREVTRARELGVWLDAGALWRQTALGPQRIGGVLAGQTRAWLGDRVGVGFYRAGGFAAGFIFRLDRGVLDDRITLPQLRGQLVSVYATIGDSHVWLTFTLAEAGKLTTMLVAIALADTRVVAVMNVTDLPWHAGLPGALAIGPQLFVPTDTGIARIEIGPPNVGGAAKLVHTRTFTETEPLVSAADRLAPAPGGIDVIRARDALRLQLV